MANNGIFYSSGNTLNFTTNNTTWATLTSGGTFVINTVSGGTYLNLPASTGSTSGAYLPLSGGTMTGGLVANSGVTATTVSATTYLNLPQSVSGTGTQDYLTKWDPSLVGIVDSTIYDNGGFVGINTTSPIYGEAVSIQTVNKGVLIDDAYVIQTGNDSLAFAARYDYTSWGGTNEIAIGSRAPLSNSTGNGNIGIGDKALLQNITGSFNIGIGATMALGNNVGGNSNIGIGADVLLINIEGSNNVSIGEESLRNNTSGSTNIAIGTSAGYSNLNDNGNVYIGDSAGYSNVGGNNIFIGYGAGSGDTSSNNRLNIGNTIFGSLSGKTIGINNLNPITTLDVSGTTRITGGLTASTVSATTYLNLPFSGTVRTSGTTTSNYIPRFTGTTTLTNSSIQDNGTNVGVNTTPSSSYKMSIYSLTNTPLYVQNQASNGTSISVYSNGSGSQTGILSIGYGGTSFNNTGVIGQAYDGLLAIGVAGGVGITEFGSITTGIGGYFDGIGDGGFGVPTNSYSVQLIDGTEGVNKVLISKTSDGKANWSDTLTGLTNVRSTTISATTYQNLPSRQTTYVFNMNSFAVPNGSLFYGVYLGGTPVNPTVVATQYGGTATDFFPGYPMPAGTASTLTIILRIAQVAPTSAMTLKLANTSTSTFGPVVTIASGSAAGTYTDNSATVGFTTNQRLTIVASNPFVAGATSGPQLTTGSFKYQLS
jgi:hypothetical protein